MITKLEIEEGNELSMQFEKRGGLLPVVVQETDTGEILMVASVNQEAFEYTLEHEIAAFFSTSQQKLWIKGESSGNYLNVEDILVDCDQDALIYKVKLAKGGVCHTFNENGQHRKSCFYRKIREGGLEFIEKMKKEELAKFEIEGDNHQMTNTATPLRPDAFAKSNEQKIETIQYHFGKIMEELGLDLTDDSLKGTPYRIAKMYVKELFYGLDPKNKPSLSVFDNKYQYSKMLIEKNIHFNSACEHHFLPIIGKTHVAYIANKKVIGLSKINRIVNYYAHRPQVQERMNIQILEELKTALGTNDVIVVVEAKHLCVSTRGIKDKSSSTTTMEYSGAFENPKIRNDFLKLI